MSKPAINEIEIFRAGRHVDVNGVEVNVTTADLAAIADDYDATLGEAPLVVGHPKLDAPAYGWVSSLKVRDGTLFAAPHQVDDAFAKLVNDGRFKKRSASFFLPKSPGNPKPGRMYLRHVGFLGAAAPAVAGLRDCSFSADSTGVVEFALTDRSWTFRQIADVFRRIRDRFVEQDGAEKTETILPSWMVDNIAEAGRTPDTADSIAAFAASTTENEMSNTQTADFAVREATLNTRETEISAREQRIAEAEAKTRRADVVEFAAGLVKEGRLLPRDQPSIVELLVSIDAAPQALSFAAADGATVQKPASEILRSFLKTMPVQVDFNERSAGESQQTTADFAAPAGVIVDSGRLEVHGKALAYQRANPNTSYLDAVRAVGG